jgi:hypothetical protein
LNAGGADGAGGAYLGPTMQPHMPSIQTDAVATLT